ncbi:uncharacterized protein BDV14DRAFT_195274 [Aspergillus stella-maris]|uniref:uncharacterized protein n=1 Tax=Aspergillus stella-maris TaxID=1810926 RepID=UPI003CCD731D
MEPALTVSRDRDDLLKRIELLEEKLRGVAEQTPVSDANEPPLAVLSSRQEDGTGSGQRTAVDEEVPVDILSTNALTEASDSEVGYFGPSSNYAMFRLVSKVFADTVMMYAPAGGAVQSLSPCHHCAERQEASRAGASSEERATPTPIDMFTLPPKGEGTDLLERFFSTIDPVLPYINKPELIETLYGGNLDLSETLKLQTLFSRWTDLSWHIGDWSDNLATIGGLVSLSEFSAGSELRDVRLAVRVLLSIQYYRMRLLVNFPLVSRFLLARKEASNELANHSRLMQELPRIVHDDWGAARELCGMISALGQPNESFTSTYPAWYTCNYTMLTVALHYFAILLVTKRVPGVLDVASVKLVREEMGEALCAMEWFGKSSLITQKAGCCIERLLNVLNTLESQPRMTLSASMDIWDTDFILQNLEQHSNKFLATFCQDEFDQQEPSFLDLYSCIPLCE